ncbi:MAG: phosphate acetyltransferase [Micrococcales bacterium]|nr:phosphate acetyltransferase [Micrococcales bacterium]
MARSVYITSAETGAVKSIVALGLVEALKRKYERVGIFRPVLRRDSGSDHVLDLLKSRDTIEAVREVRIGVTYGELHADQDAALVKILERYNAFRRLCDVVVVEGTDYTDLPGGSELALNANIAANLGTPMVLVLAGSGRAANQLQVSAKLAMETIALNHGTVIGVVANRCGPDQLDAVRTNLAALDVPAAAIPDSHTVLAPSLGAICRAVGGTLVSGSEESFGREVQDIAIGAQEVEHVLSSLKAGSVVITPADRIGVLLGLASTSEDDAFPPLAGLIVGGNHPIDPALMKRAGELSADLPIITTPLDTLSAAAAASHVHGRFDLASQQRVDGVVELFQESVDASKFLDAIDSYANTVQTPSAFQAALLERAKADIRHIVLPEGEDDRILKAAARVLELGASKVSILGTETDLKARASALGLDLSGANIVDPADPDLIDRFAEELAKIRASKGMTKDKAMDIMKGSHTFFATMMVHLGIADGMVSGACHTTADTIRPAFQIIKTAPGVEIVSSVFLMALADRVLVFGDCAVNPNPTPSQLASIAISSAQTAAAFGVEPRVAMISYSTGTSGMGPDVDAVTEATEIAQKAAPDLALDGPLQYDAAVVESVAASKRPGSPVAGKATVLIFPDLNTGNAVYKAVQRSAGALAIGPVLQGLGKPVNDLSRGALVEDIVNTVIITACQAQ